MTGRYFFGIRNAVATKQHQPDLKLIGYARVSTEEQRLDLQIDALTAAGVEKDHLHVEKVSGTSKRRPALELAIKDLRPGETLVVWRLDRLARNMQDLYRHLDRIYEMGGKFRSLTEDFEFSTVTGKFVLGILGLVAQLERDIIAERTAAGMAAAKGRGFKMGREPLMTDAKIRRAGELLNAGKPAKAVADMLGVGVSTVRSYWVVRYSERARRQIATRRHKPD